MEPVSAGAGGRGRPRGWRPSGDEHPPAPLCRRWFSIQSSQLVYQKKLKDTLTVVVEDLRLCSVKPFEDIERRFCFEVLSPSK